MSRTEDYLDSLLNNVSPERKAEADRKRRRNRADFIDDFERELNDADISDFARDFESELDSPAEDGFFGGLEGIVNEAKKTEELKLKR